jgi:hypothetical protein
VRGMSFIRGTTALAVAGAALAASGAPAAAAARPRAEMFTPRMLAAMAPKGGLLHRMAALLPGAAAPSLTSLSLFSDPATVTVNGVSYRMSLSVDDLPAALDQPPQLAVQLDRLISAGGRLTGEQEHVYGYAPIGGLRFTANAALTSATVRTGTSIAPSAIDMHFHAVGSVEQTPCTLVGGGHGVFQAATGTLSAATFYIATGTTPFFGTITTVPATATVVHDPGCATFVQSAGARPVFHQPCTGRETIQQTTLTSVWFGELGFGGGRVTQLGLTESNPFGPAGIDHLAVGIGGGTNMPRPVHTAGGGIRADVLTSGVPFMGGRARFTSTGRGRVSSGHTCTWERHTYHFTTTRYQGRLTSAGSPLQMLFDTGAEAVTPTKATLFVRKYSS